jgi:hypothetical protein
MLLAIWARFAIPFIMANEATGAKRRAFKYLVFVWAGESHSFVT